MSDLSSPGNSGGMRGAVDLSGLVRRANQPGANAPGAPGGLVLEADDAGFGAVVELSQRVPVIVEFFDDRTPETGIEALVLEYGGRIALARVDAMTSPQLVQAFQVQQLPLVAAVVAGRPVPLFAGVLPPEELRDLFEQVLALAAQQGVSGTIPTEGEAPAEIPPLHQAALDAIDAGDYPAAITAYEQAVRENPRDAEAQAALAQVRLLARLGDDADDIDKRFAAGDVEGAFDILFRAFEALPPGDAERDRVRSRLLEFFEILGEDPRVGPARRRLASLLY